VTERRRELPSSSKRIWIDVCLFSRNEITLVRLRFCRFSLQGGLLGVAGVKRDEYTKEDWARMSIQWAKDNRSCDSSSRNVVLSATSTSTIILSAEQTSGERNGTRESEHEETALRRPERRAGQERTQSAQMAAHPCSYQLPLPLPLLLLRTQRRLTPLSHPLRSLNPLDLPVLRVLLGSREQVLARSRLAPVLDRSWWQEGRRVLVG
jgi:hypothetical protein